MADVEKGASTPTATHDVLIERLRKVESSSEFAGSSVTTNWHRNPDGPEAAALIEALLRQQPATLNTGSKHG